MEVYYWSQNSRNEHFEYRELLDLLKISDVLVCALAINEQTKGIFTDEMIQNMQTKTIFVSIAHIDNQKFIALTEE